MKQNMEHRRSKAIVVMAVVVVGLLSVRAATHTQLGGETCRFFRYWEAYDQSEVKLKWWERIAYSFVQAGAEISDGG